MSILNNNTKCKNILHQLELLQFYEILFIKLKYYFIK